MTGWRLTSVAAAALMCLAIAGCKNMPLYPGDPAADPDPEHLTEPAAWEIWQGGFDDAMSGTATTSPYKGREQYDSGYEAGAKYKANPFGPKPSNPYPGIPAGYHPPSASGGG